MKFIERFFVLMVLAGLTLFSVTLSAGPNVWTTIGPFGGWVRALAVDPQSPGTVYAGGPFGGGIFKTTDGGKNWIAAGSGLTRPFVNVLAIDPRNPSNVYAGTDYGGVFKSTDGAATWRASSTGLPQGLSVFTMAIDPQNPATVYVGGFPGAMFKSTDAGASWNPAGLAMNAPVQAIAIDSRNSSTLYAGTSAGLFKSTDSGARWTRHSDLVFDIFSSLAIDGQNPSNLYARLLNRGVFKSTDGGITWVDTGPPREDGPIAIDPQNPSTLYAAQREVIVKSIDGGVSWNTVSKLEIVAGTIIFAMSIDPLNPDVVYTATQSNGVFKSTDGGTSWSATNSGLTATGASFLAIDPQNWDTLYAASQLGLFKTTDHGKNWSVGGFKVLPGFVASLTLDPQNTRTLYAGTIGDPDFAIPGAVFKSTDGGTHWSRVVSASKTTSSTETLSVNVLAVDPQNTSTVYAAIGGKNYGYGSIGTHGGVLRSTDGGANWSALNAELPAQISVDALAIDTQNTSTVYIGTGSDHVTPEDISGGVFKSTDGGESWSATNFGLPLDLVSTLLLDWQNSGTLYALTGSGVFKTSDGGISWNAANNGLPPIRASALAMDPQNSGTLYAATFNGVFKSTDGAQSWNALNYPGLPSSEVLQLIVDPRSPTTLYASAGGTVFEITFVPSSQPAPVLFSFSGDGREQGVIVHSATRQLASGSNPATAGETLDIYCTGLISGGVIPPQVSIGGQMSEVLSFYENVFGLVGVDKVSVRVPNDVSLGSAVPVRMTYLGLASNEVTIGVR